MSIDLNNNAPNDKIIFIDSTTARRMTTPMHAIHKISKTQQIELNVISNSISRAEDWTDSLGNHSGMPGVSEQGT